LLAVGIIAKVVPDEVYETAVVFHPLTQFKKKDYSLKSHYLQKSTNKKVSILTLPTKRALEQFFYLAGFSFEKLSWEKYIKNKRNWRDFIVQEVKRNSHWADIYYPEIRVTYNLYKEFHT
jgi:hypothetical protein